MHRTALVSYSEVARPPPLIHRDVRSGHGHVHSHNLAQARLVGSRRRDRAGI